MNEPPAFGADPNGRFFIKMHGLQNHFVIVDGRRDAYAPDKAAIVRICDPSVGVGGDQVVIIEKPSEQGAAAGAVAFMRILNVDGLEVEACGNATRCVAWLLLEESGKERLQIETLAGVLACERRGHRRVSCDMGGISTDWEDIPLAESADTHALDFGIDELGDGVVLNIGNPHVVFFVDDIDAIDIAKLAPPIQRHPLFPQQVNVGFAQLVSPSRMRLTVYERGAGLTSACGSGACVAVYAARLRGLGTESEMTVTMPAGDIEVEIKAGRHAVMTGPVEYCFSGFIPD